MVYSLLIPVFLSTSLQGEPGPNAPTDHFPLKRDRFGTLGAPNQRKLWQLLGARWFKAGDCNWQGGQWVPKSDVQPWLLVRARMFFTGNNRVWNPAPKPPSWGYRDQVRKFIQANHQRIGIIALGNSICFADIESGYYDIDEYVTWYHDFSEFVRGLNPKIKLAPGDLQSAWGILQGPEQIEKYMRAYRKKYGKEMPIDALGLHCYITGNKPPDWAKPEVISIDAFKQKIRTMRAWMKKAGLQDTAFIITEMGVFNHLCEPKLTEARLIEIMEGAIHFMEGPEGMDKDIGMPSDGNRLVQKWSYSAFPHLVKNGKLTPKGEAYRALAEKYGKRR
ncbi:MAG: hypothetical protein QF437_16575 [Planctomycetota bacterium]|nr:hypothetical protein [Planctomycetota bacterium]MDP7250627.1 hypothetical protein [Planctomycetota bacterium]